MFEYLKGITSITTLCHDLNTPCGFCFMITPTAEIQQLVAFKRLIESLSTNTIAPHLVAVVMGGVSLLVMKYH